MRADILERRLKRAEEGTLLQLFFRRDSVHEVPRLLTLLWQGALDVNRDNYYALLRIRDKRSWRDSARRTVQVRVTSSFEKEPFVHDIGPLLERISFVKSR